MTGCDDYTFFPMIIVTGGAGFIGSAFVHKLNQEGYRDIIIVDHISESAKWKNLVPLKYREFYHKDMFLDILMAEELPAEIDAIVHMGACSSTTEKDGDYLFENNYRYTQILAEFALENDIRFVYASSAATYGDGKRGFSDDHSKIDSLRPINMYGYSKQYFDQWALQREILNRIAGIKFFNVYGPNEYYKNDMSSVIYKSVPVIREEKKIKLFKSYHPDYGDGEQKRDFVYVKDCVDVMYWLMQHPEANGIFNLGTGQARSWNDLATAVFEALEIPLNIEYIDMPEVLKGAYQYFTQADMTKLRAAGYNKVFTSLHDGAIDYVRNYLNPSEVNLGF